MTVTNAADRLAAARERYAAARPRSAELHDRAREVLPNGSTRSVLDMEPFPFRVASASGARLVDVDGFTYLDLLGDYTAGLLGHDPGPVAAAVAAALQRGWSFGATHVDEVRLAELVCGRFPSIEQVRFTNSGTEANLMAVQLARHCTGRSEVLVFDGAYHGGLLSITPGGAPLRAPFAYRIAQYNDLESVRHHLAAEGADVACVVVEPLLGSGGCIPAEPGFLAGLRALCDEHGALLVFDEVMTSRMSAGGAQERLGVLPDLTALGKYLAGGMTFGAFGGRADLMAAFDPHRGGTLVHGGTFNNNVVTMAGGVAALGEVLTAGVLDALFERGERFRSRLAEVVEPLPMVVTGWGSMLALHAQPTAPRRPADLVGADAVVKELFVHEMIHRGVYLASRGFMALSLAVTDADLDMALDAARDTVTSLL